MQRMSINQYIGPSLANASSINEITIQPVTTVQEFQGTDNALKWNPNTGEFEKASVSIYTVQNDPEQVWTWGNPGNRDEIDSLSTVLQSHFLNDHIVTTVSWRQDDVKTFTGAAAADPADGLYNQGDPINYGDALFDETVEQTTYGIVGHVPDNWLPGNCGLSVHYVDSSNFAAGTAGNDILNNPAPLQAGNTEEYGFSLSAMDNKLYARVNFFETSQDWVKILGTLPQVGNTLAAVMNSNTPEQLAAAGWSLTDGSLFDPGTITALNLREEGGTWQADNIAGTATNYYQFTSSEGMEVEISYAPTPNWRIHMNIAEVESEVSNVMPIAGPELSRIANEVFLDPVLGDLFIVENPTQFPDGSYAENDQLWSAADNLLGAIAAKKEPEGGPLQEIRRWRVNFITNYSFSGSRWDDSFLSNFTVGGALRWQDKAAIGAGLREVDGVIVPDYEKPIYGPSETNIDAWINYNTTVMDDIGLRLQLRVRNLNKGSGDFIPLKANPDGEVALWRIGAPMYVELSARLTF
jgi:hypothetical protein